MRINHYTGVGSCIALALFAVAIYWIGCEQSEERRCRDREWIWDGRECKEP